MLMVPGQNAVLFTAESKQFCANQGMQQHLRALRERPAVIAAIASLNFQFLDGQRLRVEFRKLDEWTLSALQIVGAEWGGDREEFLHSLHRICHPENREIRRHQPSGLRKEQWVRIARTA